MLIAGLSLQRVNMLLLVVKQGFCVPLVKLLSDPFGAALGVAGVDGHAARGPLPVAQVVGDVAEGDDLPALLRQRRQGRTNTEGMNESAVVLDRKGHHRHVRRGEEGAQGHPGAVVQAAFGVGGHGQASGAQDSNHPQRPLGVVAGGVPEVAAGRINAAEVVDGRQLAGRADRGHLRLPVGTDHQHGPGPIKLRGQAPEGTAGFTRLVGEQRPAVGQEQHDASEDAIVGSGLQRVMTLAIDLSDHQAQALAEAAARLQVSEAELAAAAVRDLIAQPADDFDAAAIRVLSKNAELYRRLA